MGATNHNEWLKRATRLIDKKISRKEFGRWILGALGGAAATSAASGCADRTGTGNDDLTANFDTDFEAVIVGSGFGGSVAAARLSRTWGSKVLLVERGRRYPRGSFPRSSAAFIDAMRRDADHTPRPIPLPGRSNGLLDLRSYGGIDMLVANGYGGGSLIYGAAIIEPSHPEFDRDWPETIKKDKLLPYYDIFRQVIGARPIPVTDEPERQLPRLAYYQRVAEQTGGTSKRVNLGVFFGNDPERPTPLGKTEINQHGAEQTSCTYCAECVIGCNYEAKSSTPLNYLFVAEKRYGMQVRTETAVDRIIPLDIDGNDAPDEDGRFGYRITMRRFDEPSQEISVTTRRVVLSAGVLGTNELLLRNRNVHGTLSRVSDQVGHHFSPNGDFLGVVAGRNVPDGNAYGPTIVQSITYNDPERPEVSHVLEDMALPRLDEVLEWLLTLTGPNGVTTAFWQRLRSIFQSDGQGKNAGFATQVFVGLDKSDGLFSLGGSGELRLHWSFAASQDLYQAIINRIGDVKKAVSGWASFYLPTYIWPVRRNMTVHPLGGCRLALDEQSGVTSAHLENFGEVFNYKSLYVADASLIPSALGANPALTISALAEMVCEGITGQPATAQL